MAYAKQDAAQFPYSRLRFTIRHRIRRLYGELRLLDDQLKTATDMEGVSRVTAALEHLEAQANDLKVPVAYANQLYDLRQHIGVVRADLDRRAATYVHKIIKGAKPADLPVEQARNFELLINLKAAKQIGLIIPANVLLRADKVIK